VDDDVRHLGADVDDGLGAVESHRVARAGDAEDRERRQVDGRHLEARALRGPDRVEDRVLLRGHEQAPHHAAVVGGDLLERHEVQDCLLDRHGHEVGDLELQASLQLVGREPGEIDQADDDLLVGDAEHDVLLGELRLRPQGLDRVADGVGIDDLAVAYDARGQRHLSEALQNGGPLGKGHLCRPDARGADVQADGGPTSHGTHPSPATASVPVALLTPFGGAEAGLEGWERSSWAVRVTERRCGGLSRRKRALCTSR
jgi:hypothetical protein